MWFGVLSARRSSHTLQVFQVLQAFSAATGRSPRRSWRGRGLEMDGVFLRIDQQARVAVLTWPDEAPRVDTWLAEFEKVLSDPHFRPDFGIVSDRRALTVTPSADFVRGFIDSVAVHASTGRFLGRWATVVAPSQMGVYGMGRMTELLGDQQPLNYRVFTDLDAAIRWASGSAA